MSHKLQTILNKIDYWKSKLKEFQDNCTHSDVHIEYCSNTGNYDPTVDSYWRSFECKICGKLWIKDGHRD